MKELSGKKFVASYSGGKDSALSLYRAINSGMIPIGLITMFNTDVNRSWFHGIPENILQQVSKSVSIPIKIIKSPGSEYEHNLEKTLIEAKTQGAEICIFGDIDIDEHYEWCAQRCKNAGLEPYFPLWKEPRDKLVYELVEAGFLALITVIDKARMPKKFLGEVLSIDVANAIKQSGADICGENGEYHTVVYDGPIFSKKIELKKGDIMEMNGHIILPIY